jgi:hypothetical protein
LLSLPLGLINIPVAAIDIVFQYVAPHITTVSIKWRKYMNSPLMATAFPILVFGVAFLMLGLAKLGMVKITNVATTCWTVGIVGILFALFLYTVGLPHLVGLLSAADPAAAPLGDALAPLILQLSTVVALFSLLFIMVGYQGTGLFAHEITSTGMFAIIVGLVACAFGAIIFGAIKILGIVILLYGAACVLLGLSLRFNNAAIKLAALIVVVGSIANILIGLGFQFGMLTPASL